MIWKAWLLAPLATMLAGAVHWHFNVPRGKFELRKAAKNKKKKKRARGVYAPRDAAGHAAAWESWSRRSFADEARAAGFAEAHWAAAHRAVQLAQAEIALLSDRELDWNLSCASSRCRIALCGEAQETGQAVRELARLRLGEGPLWLSFSAPVLIAVPGASEAAPSGRCEAVTVAFVQDEPPLEQIHSARF